jgi:hypothetical protein
MGDTMSATDTLFNAIPLLVITLLGGWLLNGRLSRLERKVEALPTREEFTSLVDRVNRFDTRSESQFESVRADIAQLDAKGDTRYDSVRSDLTQIAIALGARTRPQAG